MAWVAVDLVSFLRFAAANTEDAGARVRFDGSIKEVPDTATGSRPRRVRQRLTAAELAENLNIVVSLRMRNFDELERRIHSGQAISQSEMEAKYLPLPGDYSRVVSWLNGQGFTLNVADSNHTNVIVRATVAQISAAFGVTFARVATGDGEFTSAVTAPSLPESIADVALGIDGLQPHIRMHIPKSTMVPQSGSTSVHGYFTPADILQDYNAPGNLNGAGQTIAIIMAATPLSADIDSFYSIAGVTEVPTAYATLIVNGGPTPTSENEDGGEVTLDAEWATAMAPGASLRIYAIPDLDGSDLIAACTQILNYASTDPTLKVVSYSAGGLEDQFPSDVLNGYTQTFAQLAAAGITFFGASGDGGSNPDPDLSGSGGYGAAYPLTVDYPASDPNIAGVGGTAVEFNSSFLATGSTAWTPGTTGSLGTGGGLSTNFARPSWQTGAGVPTGMTRCVPDVAAVAAGAHDGVYFGALIVVDGQETGIIGTSLSTPVWAGLTALINQARAKAALPSLGLLGPWIYELIGTTRSTTSRRGTMAPTAPVSATTSARAWASPTSRT